MKPLQKDELASKGAIVCFGSAVCPCGLQAAEQLAIGILVVRDTRGSFHSGSASDPKWVVDF